METFEAITTRRSVRAYTNEPVTSEQLAKLIDAANAAPIGMNLKQNVHLTVVQDEGLLNEFRHTLDRDLTYGAPLLIIVSTQTGDKFGPEMEGANASCVLENILLEAVDLGLGGVYLWGVSRAILPANPELAAKLKLPEGFTPFAAVAIGHPAKPVEQGERTKIACDVL